MALTFGTLLSSQGADALVVQPFRPSFEAVSPMYTALRSSQTSRACPAVDQAGGPVRSRSVQREQYTTLGAPCTGVRGGGRPPLVSPVARTGDVLGERLGSRSSGDVWWNVVRTVSLPAVHVLRHTEVGDEALPSSAAGTTPDTLAGCSAASAILVVESGAGSRPLGPRCPDGSPQRGPRGHFRLQPRSPSQRRSRVTRRRGDGTARSPGGPRAWSSSGCSAPRCAGRSPP